MTTLMMRRGSLSLHLSISLSQTRSSVHLHPHPSPTPGLALQHRCPSPQDKTARQRNEGLEEAVRPVECEWGRGGGRGGGSGGGITLGDCGLESSDEEEGAAGGRAPSVSVQVVTFVKGVLRPYHKSKLITTEEYKQVAERASKKILERHAGEASGDFLIRASEKITRLVNEYVKAVKRHRKKER